MNIRKLFVAAGLVGAITLLGAGAAVYAGTQANTINVTTSADEYNTSGTGTGCSLREAITAANTDQAFGGCPAGGGNDVVQLKNATYKIEINGTDADTMNNAKGDFDIKSDLTIYGAGRGLTFIDAQSKDRIFDLDTGTRVRITSATLRNGNPGNDVGGAIRARGYEANLDYLIVDTNTSTSAAIYNGSGDLNLYRMVVQNNVSGPQAGTGPGGIWSEGVTKISESLIYNNTGFIGGGLEARNTTIIVNTTFSGNKAGYRAGAIEFYNDALPIFLDLSNVTITGNHAHLGGQQYQYAGVGGISNTSGDNIYVRNSIIAGNVDEGFDVVADQYRAHDCIGNYISQGYNLIGDSHNCNGFSNNTNGDKVGTYPSPLQAKLGALANNGGFTWTHAPQTGSPAVDTGNPAGCKDRDGVALGKDQRGFARPVDGGVGGVRCDMGAHEKGSTTYPTPTPNPCAQKPAAPALDTPLNGQQVSDTSVALNWDGVSCASKYRVMVRQDAKKGPKVDKKSVQTTEYVTKTLTKGHKYYWFVKACNDQGCTKSQVFVFKLQ